MRACLGGPDFGAAEALFLLVAFFLGFCFVAMASAYLTLATKYSGFESTLETFAPFGLLHAWCRSVEYQYTDGGLAF